MSPTPRLFVDDRHTLYCGWVAGIALRHGVPLSVVDDADGNHTNRLRLNLPSGISVEIIVPYPPGSWSLPDG